MQTLQTVPSPLPTPVPPRCADATLVVFSTIECCLESGAAPEGGRALQWLVARGVPLVLTSRGPAAGVLALQDELGIRHPFVSGGGASLYLPAGYFPELTRIGTSRDGWHVVEFREPHDTGRAARLLVSLYRLCSESVVIVGLGDTWDDRMLLREVDVPVVVRRDGTDQTPLLHALPTAYVTTAAGPLGWSEAVLGVGAE
jgi:predicted mannosyl-3-phosphoglycerate phosphatase (HAD superfamily)